VPKCQRNNIKMHKAAGVLHPIPVKPEILIWHQAGMASLAIDRNTKNNKSTKTYLIYVCSGGIFL